MSILTKVTLRSVIADAKTLVGNLWEIDDPKFMPVTNPCSIMRSQIRILRMEEYVVGVKNDGVRLNLLLGCTDELYYSFFINRKFEMFHIEMMHTPEDLYNGSLFDGELTVDDNGNSVYVIFDVIAIRGFSFTQQPHNIRMRALEENMPFLQIKRPNIHSTQKQWYPLKMARELLATQNIDGLIFVPTKSPIIPGAQCDLFKWKPGNLNSIDLIFNDERLWFSRRGTNVEAIELNIYPDPGHMWSSYPSNWPVVLECSIRKESGVWFACPILTRDDKGTANDQRIVELTLKNIEENVGIDELIL